jgi:hypothetical protein
LSYKRPVPDIISRSILQLLPMYYLRIGEGERVFEFGLGLELKLGVRLRVRVRARVPFV